MARRKTGLEATAEGIGATLGHLTARFDALNRQRAALTEELRKVVAQGTEVLAELRRAGGKNKGKPSTANSPKMTPGAQAKLHAEWKRHQRELRAAVVKEHTKPEDERANIRAKVAGRRG